MSNQHLESDNEIVAEIRERAAAISARFGNDPRKYLEYLKEKQRTHGSRLVGQITVVRSGQEGKR
jgi:hypothetical protein